MPSPVVLTAAVQLLIVRVYALLAGAFPTQRERLIQRVKAAVRSEN